MNNLAEALKNFTTRLNSIVQLLEEVKLTMAEQKGRLDTLEKTVNSMVQRGMQQPASDKNQDVLNFGGGT